jgi:hypothetical protein
MAVRTAKQKAALKKAQLASARKRKGKGRRRNVALAAGGIAAVGVGAYATRTHLREKALLVDALVSALCSVGLRKCISDEKFSFQYCLDK